MVHESLQADIVREDCLRGLGYSSVARRGVRRRRVELRKEETSLGTACVTNDETRQREAILNEIL